VVGPTTTPARAGAACAILGSMLAGKISIVENRSPVAQVQLDSLQDVAGADASQLSDSPDRSQAAVQRSSAYRFRAAKAEVCGSNVKL
jgi:hypothetical protein